MIRSRSSLLPREAAARRTANDPTLLDQWAAQWSDLVDFEIYPVMTSEQAVEKIEPSL